MKNATLKANTADSGIDRANRMLREQLCPRDKAACGTCGKSKARRSSGTSAVHRTYIRGSTFENQLDEPKKPPRPIKAALTGCEIGRI